MICQTFLVPLLCGAAIAAAGGKMPKRGELVYRTDFEGPEALAGWQGVDPSRVRLVNGWQGSRSLQIERPTSEGPGSVMVRRALPLELLKGTRVRVSAKVKAEGVTQPPQAWNGVKVMLHSSGPSGHRWEQENKIWGTFDWKDAGFVATVPPDAKEVELLLGLEATTGRAWFDDIKVTIIAVRRASPAKPPRAPVFKGHTLPRLRGAMVHPKASEADIKDLAGWGANHVRWQLTWSGFPRSPADTADLPTYEKWLEETLAHFDRVLPTLRRCGILVALDLHTPPGGRDDSNACRLFRERPLQEKFLEIWERLARRYKGEPAIWAYDLLNEPVEGALGEGVLDWLALAESAARRIRAVDPARAIIVECAPWANPDGFDYMEPIPVPGIVYSAHMYIPHKFTHQGVYDNPKGITYPGVIDGKMWDARALAEVLEPVERFARDCGAHIYIGEFSAIRWAPGESARDWLRDVIEIMESRGWDWAYHAFREWDGWSVEHGPDPNDHSRSAQPTSRLELLRSYFAKNARPRLPAE